jgi:hypothetical protein
MTSKRASTKISNRFTELIDLDTYDLSNLYFDAPQEMEIQQGNKTIKYYKINIGNKTKAGVGEFVFNIPFMCHSFGIEEFTNESGKVTNHSVSLSMVDMNTPTDEQLNVVKKFTAFIDKVKDHLISVKKDIKKPTLDKSDLKTLNPMKQAVDEDGQPKGSAWYFSPKLMERKVYNKEDPTDVQIKIETQFFLEDQFDSHGNPVEISPLEFTGKKHFKFRGAIKIDNIYIGSKISLQCKVYDGVVAQVSKERKRLTTIKPSGAPSSGSSSSASALLSGGNDDDAEILLEDD